MQGGGKVNRATFPLSFGEGAGGEVNLAKIQHSLTTFFYIKEFYYLCALVTHKSTKNG
jgi:hypothetical protein